MDRIEWTHLNRKSCLLFIFTQYERTGHTDTYTHQTISTSQIGKVETQHTAVLLKRQRHIQHTSIVSKVKKKNKKKIFKNFLLTN